MIHGGVIHPTGRVHHEFELNPAGLFEDENTWHHLTLCQRLVQTHKHDMKAPRFQNRSIACGDIDPLDMGHGGDAIGRTGLLMGSPRLEVGEDVLDRPVLVVGFLIGEAGGKGLPHRVGCLQNGRMAQVAFGGDAHQPVGNLADAFLELGLLGLPCAAAETVKQAFLMAIAAEEFDILHRKVKLRILGIFQHHAGMGGAQGGDRLDPQIAPDPMLDMHHQVARA